MEPLNRFPTMMQDNLMARVRATELVASELKAGLRTKKDALEYLEQTRAKIQKIFGPRPRKVPFNARITGGFEREHYRVENIIFDTRPNFPVTANLYIPKNRPLPAPCVLGVCGHSFEGKACEPYQAFCQGLATKGYVVLIFDPIGQGERLQFPDGKGGSRFCGTVGDHIQIGNAQALLGEWFGNWRVWDGVRALDYLLSRPEADPTHVGLTGNSGGGTMTTWLMAADSRFTMAGPGCYVTTWRRNLENEIPADSEQNPPEALKGLLDVDDFLAMQAPKPLILLTEEYDAFDIRGSEEVYARLKHLYKLLGAEENVQIVTGPHGHGYQLELREGMNAFFNKKCRKQKEGGKEPERVAEAEELLHATKSGQVWELEADNVPAFSRRKAEELAAKRKTLKGEELKKALGKLLTLPARPAEAPDYRTLIYGAKDRGYVGKQTVYSVWTAPQTQAVLTCLDEQSWMCRLPEGKETTLYVPHLSADEDLREEPLARDLAGKGRLFAMDVRGRGDTAPNACGGNYLAAYGSDFFHTYFHQMYGESYLGQRTYDVLRVLDLLGSRGYKKVHLVGRGYGSLPALFAAVLDDRVKQVTLKNAPLSYMEIIQDEDYKWPLSSMLWGVLTKLDLPDCYRALGKKLALVEPWTSRCEVMGAKEAAKRVKELGVG
ncbi:MAG: prolyl oligopeptidase family serine peptidase [Armatimonadia bacterium]